MDLQWCTLILESHREHRRKDCNSCHDAPDDFKEAQLESITALRSNAKIGKHEDAGVLAVVFRVLEMIEAAHNTASGAACFAIFQQMQFLVRVW